MMVGEKNARLSYSAVTLVALMLFSSWTSVLASAEGSNDSIEGEVSWPQSGSVNTGWMEFNTLGGNDPTTNSRSYVDWNLEFAPGAEVSNVSLQVHVNGSTTSSTCSATIHSAVNSTTGSTRSANTTLIPCF